MEGEGERERKRSPWTQGLSCLCCGGHTQTKPNLWHYLRSNMRQQMRHHCLASFLGLGTHYMLNWGMHYEALSSPSWNQLRNKQIKTFSDQGFSLTLWSRYYDCSHFMDKATKAEAGEVHLPKITQLITRKSVPLTQDYICPTSCSFLQSTFPGIGMT